MVFGIISLCEIIILSLLVTKLFVNYHFLEENSLKKKFHWIDLLLFIFKIIIIISQKLEIEEIQFIFGNLYGKVNFYNIPLRNLLYNRFYDL